MLSLAAGTGARVRLERALAYERLAMVDVFNVLLLNVGLLLFALFHHFTIGVFVLLGFATVAANALLWTWAPGPMPSLNFRPLVGIARQSSGFLVASTCAIAREQGTPVLVGVLFGLPVAGLYSFAERVAQVLNITFDGFRNASVPAAARLAGDTRSLRALASRVLAGSSALTAPLAMLAVAGLPLIAYVMPKWSGAILLTQWYIVAYAVYGVLAASMEPAAVATMGARAAITEQATALAVGWLAFVAARYVGPSYMPVAVVLMYAAPVLALRAIMNADILPETTRDVGVVWGAFGVSLALYATLRLLSVPPLVCAVVPPVLMFALVPRLRGLPAELVARLRPTTVREHG
jgi:O-antigen/teichoic acid export membrane protein